jgi:hypothetical protein
MSISKETFHYEVHMIIIAIVHEVKLVDNASGKKQVDLECFVSEQRLYLICLAR